MHELLTQPKTPEIPRQVAGIKSEWWPASNRNGGRHQIGIPGRLPSESPVKRTVVESLQSHVDYELTPLGLSALSVITHVTAWIEAHANEIRDAQVAFDREKNC